MAKSQAQSRTEQVEDPNLMLMNPFEGMNEILEKEGWIQNGWHTNEGLCLVGVKTAFLANYYGLPVSNSGAAIDPFRVTDRKRYQQVLRLSACIDNIILKVMRRKAYQIIGLSGTPNYFSRNSEGIQQFNDHHSMTFEKISALLKDCAKEWNKE